MKCGYICVKSDNPESDVDEERDVIPAGRTWK